MNKLDLTVEYVFLANLSQKSQPQPQVKQKHAELRFHRPILTPVPLGRLYPANSTSVVVLCGTNSGVVVMYLINSRITYRKNTDTYSVRIHSQQAKANVKANFFLSSMTLFNVNS